MAGAWAEPELIALAYAYEQATLVREPPQFIPTIGDDAAAAGRAGRGNGQGADRRATPNARGLADASRALTAKATRSLAGSFRPSGCEVILHAASVVARPQ